MPRDRDRSSVLCHVSPCSPLWSAWRCSPVSVGDSWLMSEPDSFSLLLSASHTVTDIRNTHVCLYIKPEWVFVCPASPLQGSSSAADARPSSSSPAPSLGWPSVWPGRWAVGAEAGQGISPAPQHACTQTHASHCQRWGLFDDKVNASTHEAKVHVNKSWNLSFSKSLILLLQISISN